MLDIIDTYNTYFKDGDHYQSRHPHHRHNHRTGRDDGSVTLKELNARKNSLRPDDDEAKKLDDLITNFTTADTDNNGKLSKGEFVQYLFTSFLSQLFQNFNLPDNIRRSLGLGNSNPTGTTNNGGRAATGTANNATGSNPASTNNGSSPAAGAANNATGSSPTSTTNGSSPATGAAHDDGVRERLKTLIPGYDIYYDLIFTNRNPGPTSLSLEQREAITNILDGDVMVHLGKSYERTGFLDKKKYNVLDVIDAYLLKPQADYPHSFVEGNLPGGIVSTLNESSIPKEKADRILSSIFNIDFNRDDYYTTGHLGLSGGRFGKIIAPLDQRQRVIQDLDDILPLDPASTPKDLRGRLRNDLIILLKSSGVSGRRSHGYKSEAENAASGILYMLFGGNPGSFAFKKPLPTAQRQKFIAGFKILLGG